LSWQPKVTSNTHSIYTSSKNNIVWKMVHLSSPLFSSAAVQKCAKTQSEWTTITLNC